MQNATYMAKIAIKMGADRIVLSTCSDSGASEILQAIAHLAKECAIDRLMYGNQTERIFSLVHEGIDLIVNIEHHQIKDVYQLDKQPGENRLIFSPLFQHGNRTNVPLKEEILNKILHETN